MAKEITLGQYYPVDSPIHRMDPRTKLAGTIIYIVALFVAEGPLAYLISAAFLLWAIHMSRVPLSYMMRGLKPIIFILVFSAVFNLFLVEGTPIVKIWKLTITWEGLLRAIYMSLRLVFLIMGSSLMTFTTTPNQLTDGLEKGLAPLKKIKVPVHEIAMMMSIALRFIPILVDETDKITKAQTARGADFENGKLIERVKNMIPLLVPLFISAFRRASDLAMAMEARCYQGGEGRTKMKPLHYTKVDRVGYGALFGFLAVIILLKIFF